MPRKLGTIYERAEASKARLVREQHVELSQDAQRRRERRMRWPARLEFRPLADGGELIILPVKGNRLYSLSLGLILLLLIVWAVVYDASRLMESIEYPIAMVVLSLVSFWIYRGNFLAERILVMPGRRYVWQQRDLLGRLATVRSGEDPGVELTYDSGSALLILKWDRMRINCLGDADVESVQSACKAAGIMLLLPSVEQRDYADHPPPSRDTGERVIAIGFFLFLVSSGVFCYFVVQRYNASAKRASTEDPPSSPYSTQSPTAAPQPRPLDQLDGTFRSRNRMLGTWTLAPERCVSGRELGFTGIAFVFPPGSPVTELRLEAGASSENYAEWRFADPAREPYRILRRDCEMLGGKINTSEVRSEGANPRALQRMTGNLVLRCPKKRIDGSVTFDGCLPLL